MTIGGDSWARRVLCRPASIDPTIRGLANLVPKNLAPDAPSPAMRKEPRAFASGRFRRLHAVIDLCGGRPDITRQTEVRGESRMGPEVHLEPVPRPPGHILVGNLLDLDAAHPIEGLMALARKYGPIFELAVPGRGSLIVVSSFALVDE